MADSTEHIKKDLNIDRGHLPFEKQKKIFNELVEDLSGVNTNQKEALKDQINFKSDLDEIKKSKSKSEDQISVTQNVQNFADLRGKIIDSF